MNERQRRAQEFVQSFESLSRSDFNKLDIRKRDKMIDEYLTQKCIVDFWTFLRYVYRDAIQHYWPSLHGPDGLSGFLQKWDRLDRHGSRVSVAVKFIVVSREYCKTQTGIAWDVWNWVNDPNKRCLVRAYTDEKAGEIARTCRNIIGKEWFQRRFSWVKPALDKGKPVLWKNNQFMLQREDMLRTPSLEACGIKTDPTGGHFDFGHADDFEVKENTIYFADRERMIKTWRSDSNLFVAGSRRIMCGTPWHPYGLINAVSHRLNIEDIPDGGDFRNHEYDVFWQPCCIEQDWSPIDIPEPRLYEDRVTLKMTGVELPADLQTCQARITFIDPILHDTTVETREIVYNDQYTVRLNRPIPAYLEQPLHLFIPNEKPAAPNRVTLDVTDLTPAIDHEKPKLLEKYEISRSSLPKKERDQGPMMFSGQMRLRPMSADSLIFNPDDIERIDASELPSGIDYRACDFATASKTAASSVISYGRWTSRDFIITRVVRKNKMSNADKILELVLGALRAKRSGNPLRNTFFEKAQIERTLMDFIDQACRDPFNYFRALGGIYARIAEAEFSDSGPVVFSRRILPRSATSSKLMRIAEIQPFVKAGCLKIVKGCEGEEAFFDEISRCTMDSSDTFDTLDTIRDMVAEGRPVAQYVEQEQQRRGTTSWDDAQRRAFVNMTPRGFRGSA